MYNILPDTLFGLRVQCETTSNLQSSSLCVSEHI